MAGLSGIYHQATSKHTQWMEKDKSIDRLKVDFDIGKAFHMKYIQGLTYEQISKLLNTPKSTIHKTLQRFENFMKSKGELDNFDKYKVPIIESMLQEVACDMMDKSKRSSASLYHLTFAFDKIFNALRLLKGESTSNIEHAHHYEKNMAELDQEIAELEGTISPGMSDEEQITKKIEQLEENLKE